MTAPPAVLANGMTQQTAAELQTVILDLIDLGLQGKQADWNVAGPQFRTLHLKLDDVVQDARMWADDVAGRMRALGVAAGGRASVIAKRMGLEPLPEGALADNEVLLRVTDQLATAAARGRTSIGRLDSIDKISEDILIEIVERLEKHLWMFCSLRM